MTKPLTIVITGANRGIGLGLAQHYSAKGHKVIGLVRSNSSELASVADRVIDGIDLTQPADLERVRIDLQNTDIDYLLNVAGIMLWEHLDDLDVARVRQQFEVNTVAPLLLTHALRDRLAAGSKVFFLTTRLGSMADNTSGSGYGYRISKAALNMAAKTLSVDLKPRGIAVGLLHPGSVKTSLNKLGGEIEISESVAGLTARIEELTLDQTGLYVHQNGTPLPW